MSHLSPSCNITTDKHKWSAEVAFLTHLGTFLFEAQCKCYEPLWSGMHPIQASWQRPSKFPLSNSRWNYPEDRIPSQLKWENRHYSLENNDRNNTMWENKTKKRSAKITRSLTGAAILAGYPSQGSSTAHTALCHSHYHSHFLRKLVGRRMKMFRETSLRSRVS